MKKLIVLLLFAGILARLGFKSRGDDYENIKKEGFCAICDDILFGFDDMCKSCVQITEKIGRSWGYYKK